MRQKSITVAVLVVLGVSGCMYRIDIHKREPIAFQDVDVPEDVEELNAWIAHSEAQVPGIKPGNEKEIIWANPDNPAKTPLSFIYLHGFTASRREVWPMYDMVASNLGANLYYVRLAGHGIFNGRDVIADATLTDWIYDVNEAYAIGRRIGERVIVAGTSYGGTLATWLAAQTNAADTHALVLMSPCFQLKQKWKQNIAWMVMAFPWDTYLIQGSFGRYYKEQNVSDMIKRYYTYGPRTDAGLDVIDMIKKMNNVDPGNITVPVLMFYSRKDERTCPRAMLARFNEMNSAMNRVVHLTGTTDARGHHVLAGYLWASNNTEKVAHEIVDFIRDLDNKPYPVFFRMVHNVLLPEDLKHLDSWIAEKEKQVPGIQPGAAKKIRWADPELKGRTRYSIVDFHGFNATGQQYSYFWDSIASNIGANVYYTRLTAHGISSNAVGDATYEDWINDAREAYAIGSHIGGRVIVTGSSMGALLAVWLAGDKALPEPYALILQSPAFRMKDRNKERMISVLMALPAKAWLIQKIYGKYYDNPPFRSDAVFDVKKLMDTVKDIELSGITAPVLAFYSPYDKKVCADTMEERINEFGSDFKVMISVEHPYDTNYFHGLIRPYDHNRKESPAGSDIATEKAAEEIMKFLSTIDNQCNPF